jgi:cytochrome b561
VKIRNSQSGFGLIAIIFHWVMAALFFGQFWIGLTMESEPDRAEKAVLMSRHISIGFLILFLWALRLLWTLTAARPRLPDHMPSSEKVIARATHLLLLALLGMTPLIGWAILSSIHQLVPLPIRVFGLIDIPRLPLTASLHAAGLWTTLHAFLAYFMLILAAVHTLAAIRHQFTMKDGLLMRMIVPGSRLKH